MGDPLQSVSLYPASPCPIGIEDRIPRRGMGCRVPTHSTHMVYPTQGYYPSRIPYGYNEQSEWVCCCMGIGDDYG